MRALFEAMRAARSASYAHVVDEGTAEAAWGARFAKRAIEREGKSARDGRRATGDVTNWREIIPGQRCVLGRSVTTISPPTRAAGPEQAGEWETRVGPAAGSDVVSID